MHAIDLLLFDFDGTLVDTSQGIVNAANHSLAALALPTRSADEIISYVGHGLRYLLKEASAAEDEGLVDKAVRLYQDYYKKHACEQSFVYPHVIEILEIFQDKTMAIVSNKTAASAIDLLKVLRIEKYFDDVVGGDDPHCKKPSACPIDRVVNKYGLSKDRVIMIGDMAVDIIAGKNAQVRTCGVTYGMGDQQELIDAAPDHLIADIYELKI